MHLPYLVVYLNDNRINVLLLIATTLSIFINVPRINLINSHMKGFKKIILTSCYLEKGFHVIFCILLLAIYMNAVITSFG